jgi:hypothetical protein
MALNGSAVEPVGDLLTGGGKNINIDTTNI